PLSLLFMCAIAIIGRILIYQGRLGQPGTRTKLALVAMMVVLLPMEFGRDIFSTDATIGVLLVGVTLKLLEMHQKRDVLLVMYLCYFTVIGEFIYSQVILVSIYMGFCVLLITSALMSLNQTQEAQRPLRTLKMSGAILLQSVPLMLAFFILFPRISPLWSVPLQANTASTGLSENMSPGDIGNLTRSADVAFRVLFKAVPPPYADLYWRALTLDEFNGRQWRRGFPVDRPQYLGTTSRDAQAWFHDIETAGNPIDYNIIMEPHYRTWIYTLQMPRFVDERMALRRDFQVEALRPITQRFTYDARSFPVFRVDADASEPPARRMSRLEDTAGNLRARAFAAELRGRHSREALGQAAADQALIDSVLQHFRNEEFFYTLSPATLGDNPVDEFLFDTREGFCEHYASAFTFLMRAAGIPARVVTGYQGGEYNPYDGTLTVRQYDAHAWSEVWLPGTGWMRVDPTAAVAPQRIEQGSDFALQEQDSFLEDDSFALVNFRNSLMLNDLRLRLEMMDYAWNRFVLNYNQDTQFQLFNRLFGNVTRTKIVLTVVSFMLLVGVFVAFTVFRRPSVNPKPPATQQYLRFCDYLARLGYARARGETPQHYLERVSAANPQWREELQAVTNAYVELAFAGTAPDVAKLKMLRNRVRKFRALN
ncbi:MAG: transglutaminase TgpA family protein, partial [Burkholderiales bacterium]